MYTNADKIVKSVLPAGLKPGDALELNTNHKPNPWNMQVLQNQLPAPESDSFQLPT